MSGIVSLVNDRRGKRLGTTDLDHLLALLLLAVVMLVFSECFLEGFYQIVLKCFYPLSPFGFVTISFSKKSRPTVTSFLTHFRHLGPCFALLR